MAVETYLHLEVQRFVSLLLLPTGLLWLGLLALTVGLMADRRWKWSVAALCLWLAYSAAGSTLVGSWLDALPGSGCASGISGGSPQT